MGSIPGSRLAISRPAIKRAGMSNDFRAKAFCVGSAWKSYLKA
jgi:hypothetical protein